MVKRTEEERKQRKKEIMKKWYSENKEYQKERSKILAKKKYDSDLEYRLKKIETQTKRYFFKKEFKELCKINI